MRYPYSGGILIKLDTNIHHGSRIIVEKVLKASGESLCRSIFATDSGSVASRCTFSSLIIFFLLCFHSLDWTTWRAFCLLKNPTEFVHTLERPGV